MSAPSLHTTQLQDWGRRIRAGDRAATNEMLRAAEKRLEALARKMLDRFPSVRRFEETDDVLQSSLVRLVRALREVEPTSVRDFFGLAAEQMRRELVDLARHYYGPFGQGANTVDGPRDAPATGPPDPAEGPHDLERWRAFHDNIAGLPDREREVVGLIFYHGQTKAEAAESLGVNERTVRRLWTAALGRLRRAFLGEAPPA
jgi:RNA polymerase sigma-70 factor (ECF subfamily)